MVCRGGESQKDNVKKEGVCLEWEGSLPRGEGGLPVQGLFVPFAYIGSGDPVRVLHLYTTNTLDTL